MLVYCCVDCRQPLPSSPPYKRAESAVHLLPTCCPPVPACGSLGPCHFPARPLGGALGAAVLQPHCRPRTFTQSALCPPTPRIYLGPSPLRLTARVSPHIQLCQAEFSFLFLLLSLR